MSLHEDVRMLAELVTSLDNDELDENLDTSLICFAMLEDAKRNLSIVVSSLEKKLARVMPRDYVLDGVGTFEKRARKSRTQWQKEDLLRAAVLDSRRFDHTTGELIEETPLERVLAVWNLGAPRTTVLKDRGIDADEFAHVEDAGHAIRLITT